MYDESKHTPVTGTAVVVTAGGGNSATLSWLPERSLASFQTVPAKSKLVVTDFVYIPQGDVSSRHIINIAEQSAGGSRIIRQLFVNAKTHTQSHFHTGFVIAPGNSVVAFSDANGPAGKHVSLTLNGYVAPLGRSLLGLIARNAADRAKTKATTRTQPRAKH